MAALFESGLNFAVVVDFAVEGDPDRFVFVGEGLMTAAEIDDGETSLAEDGTGGALGKIRDEGIVETAIVGTAMDEDVGHRADDLGVDGICSGSPGSAGDSTHEGLGSLEEGDGMNMGHVVKH